LGPQVVVSLEGLKSSMGVREMRSALIAGALLLGAVLAAPPADAQDEPKKAKKVKVTKDFYKFDWGRRADITQPIGKPFHQHPYTKLR